MRWLRRPATLLLSAAILLGGCGAPRPTAPFSASVRDATLSTTIRTDVDDADLRRAAADRIRATQSMLEDAVGRPSPPSATVWLLTPQHLDRFLARVGEDDNTGAATIVSNRRPEVFTHAPARTATADGDATQRLHSEFVLAHEYTHAWLNTRHSSDLEEGFANWIAVRSMRDRSIDGISLEGAERVALVLARLSVRSGVPVTVDHLLRSQGEDAYVFGTTLYLWLEEERKNDEAFRTLVKSSLSAYSMLTESILAAGLREKSAPKTAEGPAPSIDARFMTWVDAADSRRRAWWVPLGYFGAGSRRDGSVVLADDSAAITVSFAQSGAIPEEARALDLRVGRPPLDRVESLELVVHGQGLVIDPEFRRSSIAQGVLIAAGEAAAGRRRARAIADGTRVTLRCEGADVVLSIDGTAIHRFPQAACSLFAIGVEGWTAAGLLPVLDVRPLRRTDDAPSPTRP